MSADAVKRYVMVIDTFKCIDCKACMIACKVENNLPKGFWRNWIRHGGTMEGKSTQYQPGQCMQCDEPSCVAACPVGATFKQKDGLVVIDATKCIGCGNCVTACPYGARYRNPWNHVADKCDFCLHRLKKGQMPACVETCPTKARIFGDLNNPRSEVNKMVKSEKLVRILHPVVNTGPAIYYVAGAQPLDWPIEPTLPGNVHMSPVFWKTG